MTAEGHHIRRVSRWGSLDPTWAPDGHRIAYSAGARGGLSDIFVVDLRSHRVTNLTRTENQEEFAPAWSPGGRQIAYLCDCGSVDNSAYHLYVMRADGSARRRLTRGREISPYSAPDWSPDGSRLLFGHGDNQITLINADGTGERLLVRTTRSVPNASWSPDGHRIVFSDARGVDGVHQLYVLRADGSAVRRVTHSRRWHAIEPNWQPLPNAAGSNIASAVTRWPAWR